MPNSNYVIAVDLGGTNLRLALVDQNGDILARHAEPTKVHQGLDALLDQLANRTVTLPQQAGIPAAQIQAVGFGIPGLVELAAGRVVKAPNIPVLDGVPLGPRLQDRLPWPVVLDNDANLFALGEATYGAGRSETDLLGITLGTGVGGGLILAGQLWHGASGTAAEIGHMTIEPAGDLCNCGNVGCLETLASATWTVKWFQARLQAGEASALRPLWQQRSQDLSARRIAEAARAGDALAQQAMDRVGRALGIAIANVVHLLGVPTVILGGKFAGAWDGFFPALDRELRQRLTFFPRSVLQIRPAILEDNAGLMGAAKLAWDVSR